MAPDLTPLEQAAARVGLPGLKARIVPHDRRRGWWFRWGGGELLVSDRIIDRCTPEDACALLIDDVLRHRRLRRARLELVVAIVATCAFAILATRFVDEPDLWNTTRFLALAAACLLGAVLGWPIWRARAAETADDRTVVILGDATPLVRGLNEMNFEELHIAGKRLPARPDLHRRAERLVRLHRLCEAQPPA